MRTITLEEHFVTQDFIKATDAYGAGTPQGIQEMRGKLLDLGEGRLAAMDEAGIHMQVLSLAALGVNKLAAAEQTAVLRGVHDELASAVAKHPDRFKAFATPGLKEPQQAVKEIERCVRELGFVGVLLDGTTDGKFLDAPEFFPVLEAIAELGVPLYVHPAPPPRAVTEVYYSGLPEEVGHLLSIAGWGWHAENGLHMLRLIVSGVMDRLPKLRVIVGHMGEGVPYALARSSGILSGPAKLQRSVADTLKAQFWVTTSGYFTRPPFECARAVLGFDRLMYSVDYPFSPNIRGVDFLKSLELSAEDEAAFRGGHAAAVLGV
ncbi:MAG TPA: amidohydrolase family protein [Acidobacteriaceae bacterium]|nr:amidohydrolase family protein [Acidobacteriaceae bacterium]